MERGLFRNAQVIDSSAQFPESVMPSCTDNQLFLGSSPGFSPSHDRNLNRRSIIKNSTIFSKKACLSTANRSERYPARLHSSQSLFRINFLQEESKLLVFLFKKARASMDNTKDSPKFLSIQMKGTVMNFQKNQKLIEMYSQIVEIISLFFIGNRRNSG